MGIRESERRDCINWNQYNPSLRNHCTALNDSCRCTDDCVFYAPMDPERLKQRELDIENNALKHGAMRSGG